MQRIIKNDQVVTDNWHLLDKGASLEGVPNSDNIIVPLALWREHAHALGEVAGVAQHRVRHRGLAARGRWGIP